MAWRIEFAQESEHDFELILRCLFAAYQELGDTPGRAFQNAWQRVDLIRASAQRIAEAPLPDALDDDIKPGLRRAAIGKAFFLFRPDAEQATLRILAVSFGRPDRLRHMLCGLPGTGVA